jgi:AraC family L-rhamnose operon regulatory protein RhaS
MEPVPPSPRAERAIRALVRSPRRIPLPGHGVVVFESRHAPGFAGELRDDFAKFLLVVAGRARWDCAGSSCLLEPGMLVHIAAGVPHAQRDLPGQPVTLYAIHFRPQLLPQAVYAALAGPGMLPIAARGGRGVQQVRPLFQEMLFEQDARPPGWEAVLHARLLEIAALGLRRAAEPAAAAPVRDRDGIGRVSGYVRQLGTSFFRPASIAAAAQAVGLSRRQFTELFRKVTGESWSRHVQRLRLEHAARLLAGGERSVTAVAFESGFEDLSHFHHAFKKAHGCTPGDYRGRHRPEPQPPPPASPSARRRRG